MDPIAWFMGYRILIVLGGILSIYFGYRLFYIEKSRQGELQLKTGANYELSLRDVAPGIFFALFGALILATCLIRGVTLRPGPVETSAISGDRSNQTQQRPPIATNVSPGASNELVLPSRSTEKRDRPFGCMSQRSGEC